MSMTNSDRQWVFIMAIGAVSIILAYLFHLVSDHTWDELILPLMVGMILAETARLKYP